MHSSTLLSAPDVPLPSTSAAAANSSDLEAPMAFAQLRAALADYAECPGDADTWKRLIAARSVATACIARLPRKETQSITVTDARDLVREMTMSGAHDRRLAEAELKQLAVFAQKGWPGLLAAMLLSPAWQWSDAPSLVSVPDWLRADYVAWLFAAPQNFRDAAGAEHVAAHTLRRLEELVRWVKRSPGAAAEAEVLEAYSRVEASSLYGAQGGLRRQAELRAQLLARAFRQEGDVFDFAPSPRAGRRLRVGFVSRDFGVRSEVCHALPLFEHLDADRFEVNLFASRSSDSAIETRCRRAAADFFILPDDLSGQLGMLRASALDVVVFCSDLAVSCDQVTRIALHRVAPLQVLNGATRITSGFSEMDLYLSPSDGETQALTSQFTERLGVLSGAAVVFNGGDAEEASAVPPCTRSELGIPDDAFVIAVAPGVRVNQDGVLRLLKAVPSAHFLVVPRSSSRSVALFRAALEQAAASVGNDNQRVLGASTHIYSENDSSSVLKVADVFLDLGTDGEISAFVSALECGVPAIALEGSTARAMRTSALLKSAGLGQLVAAEDDAGASLVTTLVNNAGRRGSIHDKLVETMAKGPLFRDTLATSDAFGEWVLHAFDEVVTMGLDAFRNQRNLLRAPALEDPAGVLAAAESFLEIGLLEDARQQVSRVLATAPASVEARRLMAKILLATGNVARAADYLVAAVQNGEAPSELWRELADALQRAGNGEGAVMALETSLRVDPRNIESWFMLGQVARSCGHGEILAEVMTILGELAPGDPRYDDLRDGAAASAVAS